MARQHVAKAAACTHLIIRARPVDSMDDVDVDIGEPFRKSEELKEKSTQVEEKWYAGKHNVL